MQQPQPESLAHSLSLCPSFRPPSLIGTITSRLPTASTQTIRYRIKRKAVEAVEDRIGLMGKLNLAPPSTVLDVLERALVIVGKAKADLCDARCAGKVVPCTGLKRKVSRSVTRSSEAPAPSVESVAAMFD